MLALIAPAGASAAPSTRIIVKRDAGLSAAERADIRADAGVRLVDTLSLARTEVVTAPAAEATQALRELNADPDVVYAEIDRPVKAFASGALPNDPEFGRLWGLRNVGNFSFGPVHAVSDADMDVNLAWDKSTGVGRTIAVVDTGVDGSHPDLEGHVAPGWDFVDDDPYATDPEGHGTHVAGTIAATRDNAIGVVGVAPGARILPLRAIGEDGSGHVSDVIEAYDFAGDHGIRLVNASLGGNSYSQSEHDAIARHPNTLFVVAAGNGDAGGHGLDNDDPAQATYPCAYDLPNILCVGASLHNDEPAEFSNYGDETVDVFAPGYGIYSTMPGGGYDYKTGTSMATPHVAGEAALLLSRNPKLSPADLRAAVVQSADYKTALDGLAVSGGRANADHALTGPDWDGDGIPDGLDNCPSVENAGQEDADDDGVGDACNPQSTDEDDDGVEVPTDRCPFEPAEYSADGCIGNEPSADGDYWPDALDQCPAQPGTIRGCPDTDNDGIRNTADNCATTPNQDQKDLDHDGQGDLCDPDRDGDGVLNGADHCPDEYGPGSNHGCKVIVAPPKPTPAPPPAIPDTDGDGFKNNVDACRTERGVGTRNGCPLPAVTALSARARKSHGKRSATITVRTSRAAYVRITIERKKCRRHHCRWARVTRRTLATSSSLRVSTKARRLSTGSYRVVVVVSSAAGRAHSVTRGFRVR